MSLAKMNPRIPSHPRWRSLWQQLTVSLQLTIAKKSSNKVVTKILDQVLIVTVLITKYSLGVTLKDTNFPFGSVSTSVTHSRPRWSRTSNLSLWLGPRERKMVPTNYFLYGVFDRGISDAAIIGIYHAVTKRKNLIQFQISPCNRD